MVYMPNSIDFYERIFLHVIPVSIIVPWLERALGIFWNPDNDTSKVKAVIKSFSSSKRDLLSFISSVFDPLGLLTQVNELYNSCGKLLLIGMKKSL